jgi:hypothetical protein
VAGRPSGSNDVPPKMRRYGTPTLYHGLQELFMYLREKFAAKLNDGSWQRAGCKVYGFRVENIECK